MCYRADFSTIQFKFFSTDRSPSVTSANLSFKNHTLISICPDAGSWGHLGAGDVQAGIAYDFKCCEKGRKWVDLQGVQRLHLSDKSM